MIITGDRGVVFGRGYNRLGRRRQRLGGGNPSGWRVSEPPQFGQPGPVVARTVDAKPLKANPASAPIKSRSGGYGDGYSYTSAPIKVGPQDDEPKKKTRKATQ
jgi:uncharacterized protein YgiB involved in biofilm formation